MSDICNNKINSNISNDKYRNLNLFERLARHLGTEDTLEFRKKIKNIILGLDDNKKRALIKRFGINFNEVRCYENCKRDEHQIDYIVCYIMRLFVFLKNGGRIENFSFLKVIVIYERLASLLNVKDTPEFRKRIDDIISTLNDEEKKFLTKAYGNDFSVVSRSSEWVYRIDSSKLKILIEKIKKNYEVRFLGIKNKCFVMFYTYLSNLLNVEDNIIFRTKVNRLLLQLDDDKLDILRKIYGDNFIEINKFDNYSFKDIKKRDLIIEELLQSFQFDDGLYIDSFVGRNSYDILCEACELLTLFDKSIVKRLFGDNYDLEFSPDNVFSDELSFFENKIVTKIIANIKFVKNSKKTIRRLRNRK